MVFGKKNYILLAVSVGIIILGLLLMSGGGSADSTEFTAEIFSTRRIVVAPIVTLIGFLMIIYAIMAKPKSSNKSKGKNSDTTLQNK
ncbi:DUF3098 domain-containing protein [Porphyromonas asaccharolytica]|uniref:DUF3098 domain-containing protein n=1 Tax=Porphyromonas asaccharolytica (strain ATCC 25260 / DSM 20707 / BCRC 10618 / CCUG 7834 / JCM 6326 / LMG 13178 / VPI 4198 / B440) TaxID=879243 RepID=F4KP40_PORAD|nr:DUF3098 domain-containing protein [Porphyromonas asaccharolytica]AEE13569.1 hypothetical protein Poras_1638 [Porphyromonas asaccharolytica DSM 20707]EFR33987.1 hypothetical protein HMPREF9294_1444 [Porphyromonas asaccharolytica PR426713P-I]